MRAYELMVIFDGDLDDSNAAQASNRVTASAEEFGASIEKNDWWGRRKFAYEIDHKVEGYYLVLELVQRLGRLSTISTGYSESRTMSFATNFCVFPITRPKSAV